MVKNKAKESNQQSSKRAKIDEQPSFLTDEEKRVILIQYQKEHESDSTNDLLVEYLKFMQIKIRENNTNTKEECAAPSKMIDEMWHAHILSTKEYMEFCERHNNGDFIHHDPSMMDVPARYRITWRRYVELFKSEPKDRTIWPMPIMPELEEVEEEEEETDDWIDDYGCG